MPQDLQFTSTEITPPQPAVSSGEISPVMISPLPKMFFLFFLASFVVFLPFGMLLTKTTKEEKQKRTEQYQTSINRMVEEDRYANTRNTPRSKNSLAPDSNTSETPLELQPLPVTPPMERALPSPSPSAPSVEDLSVYQLPRDEKIHAVRLVLEAHLGIARECRKMGLPIMSGRSLSRMCGEMYKWGQYTHCGPNPEDVSFTVFKGDTDEWDYTISCKNIPHCNGPENAICNKNGCTFSGTCQIQ